MEDMTLEQMSAENGYDALFARLDKGFKYDPLTELPDALCGCNGNRIRNT